MTPRRKFALAEMLLPALAIIAVVAIVLAVVAAPIVIANWRIS